MKATIIAVLAMIILGSFLLKEEPVLVTTPEVRKTIDYKRPVREGNCWRQFIGTGDTDSILVCH
jgi:hypothetical protein